MAKVNLFFWQSFLILILIILPFSAMAAEEANDETLEEVERTIAIKKYKGTINEDKFIDFINYAKYTQSGKFCYNCKTGLVLEGQTGSCNVRISELSPP